MSVYSRSDLMHVAVPVTSGGCGQGHGRPVVKGAPVKVWELDCPQCGNYLRSHDPHWAGMVSEIPETPDEIAIREDEEKRGQRETAAATSHALVQIADLPTGMATAFAQAFAVALKGMNGTPQIDAGLTRCPAGHPVPGAALFCPECGSKVHADAPKVVESTVVKPEDPRAAGPLHDGELAELENKSMPQLREVAQRVGAKIRRSRDEQVAEIRAALLIKG